MIKILQLIIIVIMIAVIHNFTLAQIPLEETDVIIGTWLMPEDDGIIEISKNGEFYNGKIIWMKEREEDGSSLKDKENPVDSLRNRTVEGLQVMTGFKYEGDNVWSGGTFYAAKKGKVVEPEFVLKDDNHLDIEISFFIFSLTVELKRVDTKAFFESISETKKL